MEDSPSRPIHPTRSPREPTTEPHKMSMLAMTTPAPHLAFGRQYPWEAPRCPDYSLRPRAENERVALPSIRQAFPELQLQVQPQDATGKTASTPHSTSIPGLGSTSPHYVHSPNTNKRRRLSIEDEQEKERTRQVPRLYYSPERASSRHMSPTLPPRQAPQEPWMNSARSSPFISSGASNAPTHIDIKERVDGRPALPPPRPLDRETTQIHHGPAPTENFQNCRPPMSHPAGASAEPSAPPYRDSSYAYSFHHPSRYQSLSASSVHQFDRTPFVQGSYGAPYQDFVRFGDMGSTSLSGDNKQRKRRGNLPKETTDKLRAWFMAHLQHPYPTEDEKQDLMRQTGLQMNQISNWFINARRRQLPTMINNARAESDAMTGARDMKVLATTERGDYEHGKRQPAGPLSDGEGAAYEEDLEALHRHRVTNMSRGSV